MTATSRPRINQTRNPIANLRSPIATRDQEPSMGAAVARMRRHEPESDVGRVTGPARSAPTDEFPVLARSERLNDD
jgi:hypothetical protein